MSHKSFSTWSALPLRKRIGICILVLLVAASALPSGRAKSQTKPPIQPQEPTPKAVSAMIETLKSSGTDFPVVELLQAQSASAERQTATQEVLSKSVHLNFNANTALSMSSGQIQTLTLPLPNPAGGTVELELTKVNLFAPGFNVMTSSSNGQPVPYELGAHYRGMVKGVPGSLAAISVFSDEIMGLWNTPTEGTFVLGRLGGNNVANEHILYAQSDLKADAPFTCETKDEGPLLSRSELEPRQSLQATTCVRIYVEADNDLFQNKGSVAATTNYVTGLFNQSATIFANENVPITMSELFIWDTTSPYTASSAGALLDQFQSVRNSFNGDLGHLIALRGNGGVAASLNGFCNPNTDSRQCFSGIRSTFQNVPTYSWTIDVFTHEMGHLMGSPHTHACRWNGDNTPIDGCAAPEGSCPRPAIPPGGGTIMSYCHLTSAGKNLALGFGPQPGNLIRNRFANAACLQDCGTGCSFAINPTSQSFAASGGNGSVSVTTASGCAWTATSNANFINITSGSSGNGNGTVNFTVAANATTSARTGTLTIAGRTFTVNQAAGSGGGGGNELIVNGGLETGTTPWTLTGQAFRSTGRFPRSGTAYALLGTTDNATGSISQSLTIPSGTAPRLSFFLNITSNETSSTRVFDRMFVEVRSTSGALLATLATFSNLNKGTAGTYVASGPFALSNFAGQTVRIQFRCVNDSSLPTSFRVDDISVK